MQWKSTASPFKPFITHTIGGQLITPPTDYNGPECPKCQYPMKGSYHIDGWVCTKCGTKMGDCFVEFK
jgi:hypothetical protein